MKYWVYKESRILGPFDKEALSSLPQLDSETLVCSGDPSGNSWIAAGELADIATTPARSTLCLLDDPPSSIGLLDQLQIDSAGVIGDDEFPGSFAEEFFQDSSLKKSFGDALSTPETADSVEARHAREKISELTIQLEAMCRRIAELEAGQTGLVERLAAKSLELRPRDSIKDAPIQSSPFSEPPPPAVPHLPPLPEIPSLESALTPDLPVISAPAPSAAEPVVAKTFLFSKPKSSPFSEPPPPAVPHLPLLPEIPSLESALTPDLPTISAPAPSAAEPAVAKTFLFSKPKSFKVVPAIKSFPVLSAAKSLPCAVEKHVPVKEIVKTTVLPPLEAPMTPPVVMPTPAPIPRAIDVPISIPAPASEPSANLFVLPTPPPLPPPNTPSCAQLMADLAPGDSGGLSNTPRQALPVLIEEFADAAAPVKDTVAARFERNAPTPPTGRISKPARNNKSFLLGIGALLVLLMVVGVIFMRQPQDELKHMATLDDGKAPIGLPPSEITTPPIVKPKIAETPAALVSPPGHSSDPQSENKAPAEHAAAIGLVKDFPLDGGRSTVGRWLQYSYTASPNSGAEEWNASSTGANTLLVEYRMIPGVSGGKGALYLFEVDTNGLVIGKNIEARQMLAGRPRSTARKAKKRVKKVVFKNHIDKKPKELPLLPLPKTSPLRPPTDDEAFGLETEKPGN